MNKYFTHKGTRTTPYDKITQANLVNKCNSFGAGKCHEPQGKITFCGQGQIEKVLLQMR
jgi:hypothetical protein